MPVTGIETYRRTNPYTVLVADQDIGTALVVVTRTIRYSVSETHYMIYDAPGGRPITQGTIVHNTGESSVRLPKTAESVNTALRHNPDVGSTKTAAFSWPDPGPAPYGGPAPGENETGTQEQRG